MYVTEPRESFGHNGEGPRDTLVIMFRGKCCHYKQSACNSSNMSGGLAAVAFDALRQEGMFILAAPHDCGYATYLRLLIFFCRPVCCCGCKEPHG